MCFQVVPSQINYLIKTRFTESRVYCESKRGGGWLYPRGEGQFQITIRCSKTWQPILERAISQQVFNDITLRCSMKKKLLTKRETQLLPATTSDSPRVEMLSSYEQRC